MAGTSGPEYPNQQLKSVSLETYFKGKLDVVIRLGEVQARFSERLSELYVPNVQAGDALALRPYQLRPPDQSETLAVAVNQATYASFRYPGYTAFIAQATTFLEPTLAILGIDRLERVVYRYENEIALSRDENQEIPVQEIVCVAAVDVEGVLGVRALDVSWTRRWLHGTVGAKVVVEAAPHLGIDVLRISIFAEHNPAGAAASLRDYADSVHALARSVFESMITAEFRTFLRGGQADA